MVMVAIVGIVSRCDLSIDVCVGGTNLIKGKLAHCKPLLPL